MKIKCPDCDTGYDVSEEIAQSGAQVRCARCDNIFTARPVDIPEPENKDDQSIELEAKAPEDISSAPDDSELLSDEEKEFFASLNLSPEEQQSAPETVGEPVEDQQKLPDTGDLDWVEPQEQEDDEPLAHPPEEPPLPEPETEQQPAELEMFDEIEIRPEEPPETEPVIEQKLAIDEPQEQENDDIFDKPAAPGDDQPQKYNSDDMVEITEQKIEKPAEKVKATSTPAASSSLLGWVTLAAGLLIFTSSSVVFRVGLVKAVPGLAGIYEAVGMPVNVRGLEFARLSHQWVEKEGRMRLVVRGEIVNITSNQKPVPEIVFAMLDAGGMEFFQWTERLDPAIIAPRGTMRFRAQIPAPANRVKQLQVRFVKH